MPEPSTVVLLGGGLAGITLQVVRRQFLRLKRLAPPLNWPRQKPRLKLLRSPKPRLLLLRPNLLMRQRWS